MAKAKENRIDVVNAVSYTHLDVYKRQPLQITGLQSSIQLSIRTLLPEKHTDSLEPSWIKLQESL